METFIKGYNCISNTKKAFFKALTHKVESNLFSAMINEVFAGKKKIQSKAHTKKKKERNIK